MRRRRPVAGEVGENLQVEVNEQVADHLRSVSALTSMTALNRVNDSSFRSSTPCRSSRYRRTTASEGASPVTCTR